MGSSEFVGSFAVGWPVAVAAAAAAGFAGFAGSFVEFPWLRVSQLEVGKQQPVVMRLFLDAAAAAAAAAASVVAVAIVVVAVVVAIAVAAVVAAVIAAVVATVAVVVAADSCIYSFLPSTLEDP